MARARGHSFGEGLKAPHTVSLKVLRLTRPSLFQSYALPTTAPDPASTSSYLTIAQSASLAYPASMPENPFILTPVLTLPESFQSAYVGEVFSCTLCANNELSPSDTTRRIDGVRMQAEIQSPTLPAGVGLELEGVTNQEGESDTGAHAGAHEFGPGASLQRIIRLNLKEEGNHVLAVTVTYTETTLQAAADGDGQHLAAQGGRVRTFRKLYQFVAQSLIGVRTKAGDVPARDGKRRFAIEAQLENMGERVVSLEAVSMGPRAPFKSSSLNWDVFGTGADPAHAPILNPHDVIQVAFLLEEQPRDAVEAETSPDDEMAPDGKIILGQLNIQWRAAMGDRGSLSTGWLVARQR